MPKHVPPVLTEADIDIGGMFLYEGDVWTRTDRNTAHCKRFRSCYFASPAYDAEGGDVEAHEIQKLDMAKVEALLLANIDSLKI